MPSPTEYKEEFIRRTKQAREKAGLTQHEIATALGISQGKYKQYEVRSPLPHVFVPAFCIATRCDISWLFGVPRSRRAGATADQLATEPAPTARKRAARR